MRLRHLERLAVAVRRLGRCGDGGRPRLGQGPGIHHLISGGVGGGGGGRQPNPPTPDQDAKSVSGPTHQPPLRMMNGGKVTISASLENFRKFSGGIFPGNLQQICPRVIVPENFPATEFYGQNINKTKYFSKNSLFEARTACLEQELPF